MKAFASHAARTNHPADPFLEYRCIRPPRSRLPTTPGPPSDSGSGPNPRLRGDPPALLATSSYAGAGAPNVDAALAVRGRMTSTQTFESGKEALRRFM